MPWNEVSRRYVDEEPEFFYPKEWRAKAENVKQGSSETIAVKMYAEKEEDFFIEPTLDEFVQFNMKDSIRLYNDMLKADVAPEQARMVLPQNMMTEWWWSGTLGAYADMLRLRLDPHTQYESRIVANLIHKEIQKLFPISIKALLES